MNVRYDAEADGLYIQLANRRILDSQMVAPGIVLDYDHNGQVVGIEMLSKNPDIDLASSSIPMGVSGDSPVAFLSPETNHHPKAD